MLTCIKQRETKVVCICQNINLTCHVKCSEKIVFYIKKVCDRYRSAKYHFIFIGKKVIKIVFFTQETILNVGHYD